MAQPSDSSFSASRPSSIEEQKNQERSVGNASSPRKLSSSLVKNPTQEALGIISFISGTDGHTNLTTSLGAMDKLRESPAHTSKTSKETDAESEHLSSPAFLTNCASSDAKASATDKTQVHVTCTLTTAHHESIVSVIANSIPASKGDEECVNRKKEMSEITQRVLGSTDGQPSDQKTALQNISISNLSSSSWSSSTDTNFDCESGSCQGTEIKCRLCGKIVPKSNKMDQVSCSGSGENLESSMFCDGSLNYKTKPKGISTKSVHSDGSKSFLPKKKVVPSNYSTLLSTCGRPPQTKGNRRSSVDVIYARESREPAIDKIKAKRRLSRQTDISSFELRTLTEGNENDDANEQSKVEHEQHADIEAKKRDPFSLFPELRLKENSVESLPRVPFNSFETASSLEEEDKLPLCFSAENSLEGRPKSESNSFIEEKPDHHQQEGDTEYPEKDEEEEQEEEDEDEGEEGEEAEEVAGATSTDTAGVNDVPCTDAGDTVDRDPTASRRFVRVGRQMKNKKPPCKKKKRSHGAIEFDWTSEALIIVALFVYLACKTLRFLEIFNPRPQKKTKK